MLSFLSHNANNRIYKTHKSFINRATRKQEYKTEDQSKKLINFCYKLPKFYRETKAIIFSNVMKVPHALKYHETLIFVAEARYFSFYNSLLLYLVMNYMFKKISFFIALP